MIQIIKTAKPTNFITWIVLVLFTGLLTIGCSKSHDAVTTNSSTIATTTGNWRISLYWDKKDETSNFSGYNFSFNTSGQVTASNGTNTVNGTWTESSTRMTLNFGADPLLSKINNDYLKEEKTTSSIKLKDDNPTKDEKLYFLKN